jgi:hypothetical protein
MSFGDQSTLPDRLKSRVTPSDVIYWSSPAQDKPIGQAYCGDSAGVLIVLPCFWFHLVILSPCICCCTYYTKSKALRTDVVLTKTTLELIVENGSQTSFPLQRIQKVTATTKTPNTCSPKCCMKDVNRLIIDDGRVGHGNNGTAYSITTTIWAHENIDEFRRLILETKSGKIQAPSSLVMSRSNDDQSMIQMQVQGPRSLDLGGSREVTPSGYSGVQTQPQPDPNAYPSRFS